MSLVDVLLGREVLDPVLVRDAGEVPPDLQPYLLAVSLSAERTHKEMFEYIDYLYRSGALLKAAAAYPTEGMKGLQNIMEVPEDE